MWVHSRQFTGRIVTVSNSKIFAEPVFNYTRDFPFIWEEMAIPITYVADRARAEAILLEAARLHATEANEMAVKAILANRIAPGLIDKYLASAGYSGQLTDENLPPNPPANLFDPEPGDYGAHSRFDSQSKLGSWEMFTDRHRTAFWATIAGVGLITSVHLLAKKLKI